MSIDTKKLRQAAASVRAFLKPEYGREIAAAADHIDAQAAEIEALHSIVKELVACDDLKKRIAVAQHACIPESDEDFAEMDSLSGDLAKRNPVAWSAARAALAQHQGDAT